MICNISVQIYSKKENYLAYNFQGWLKVIYIFDFRSVKVLPLADTLFKRFSQGNITL